MSDKKIEDLKASIESMEKELAEAKKAYREMKTKGELQRKPQSKA